eukprot:1738337-Prymnesium_polylepis.1
METGTVEGNGRRGSTSTTTVRVPEDARARIRKMSGAMRAAAQGGMEGGSGAALENAGWVADDAEWTGPDADEEDMENEMLPFGDG